MQCWPDKNKPSEACAHIRLSFQLVNCLSHRTPSRKNILQGWLDSTVPFIKAKKRKKEKVDKVRLALRAVLNKFGSITDFNINKNIFLSINSCDTEDCCNDAENSPLITGINYILKDILSWRIYSFFIASHLIINESPPFFERL